MIKKIENIFIWIAGGVFLVSAIVTIVAWMFGLFAYVTGHLNG